MPRDTSDNFKRAFNASQTSEAAIFLLTISHPKIPAGTSMAAGIRYFAGNYVNIVSRGNIYYAAPFLLSFPHDRAEELPTTQLMIDNIDRQMVDIIRACDSKPTMLLEVVLGSSPDTIEASFDFMLKQVDYDAFTITGTMGYEDILNEPIPGDLVTPASFPGAFKT